MSGAGRKVFQPGEVLTASNVQNYLQDQAVQVYAGTAARGSAIGTATTEGMMSYLADSNSVQMATGTATWVNVDGVPIVAGTAARDTLYPSPIPGNIVFRSDSLQQETYYAATGSPSRAAGWYSGQDGGLVPIIPTSVTVGSGSASVANNGAITFTSVSSLSLNGIFSSTYESYRVVLTKCVVSSDAHLKIKMRSSGTDSSAGYYTGTGKMTSGGTLSAGNYGSNGTGGSELIYMKANGTEPGGTFDIHAPFSTVATKINISCNGNDGTNKVFYFGGAFHDVATSYDGCTFFPGAGNITGILEIYGYRN